MVTRVGVVWRDPFTVCERLELLPGAPIGVQVSSPAHVSSDGNTVVGWALDADGNQVAVKWEGTTVTSLAHTTTPSSAVYCVPDASTILGTDGGPVQWTSGGSMETSLLPAATYAVAGFSSALPGTGISGGVSDRLCSDDASRIVGSSISSLSLPDRATRWDVTVPTALPSTTIRTGSGGLCCSADGSLIVGEADNFSAGFWLGTGTTFHTLYQGFVSVLPYQAQACNDAGTIIWGICWDDTTGSDRPCYWDSLTTTSIGGLGSTVYGVQHFLNGLEPVTDVSVPVVTWVAGGTIEPIAVGFGHTSAGAYHGARWNGITITDLGALAGGNNTEAYGCSATGARVCGGGYEGGTNNYRWAIYWDDSGTLHQLPTLPDAATEFGEYKGEAWGMSRDGSTIYGIVDIEDDVPAGETLTDSELLFQPQHGFVDLSVAATRQLFVSLSGTPQWMGVSGEIPFAQQPAVYLTTLGPPLDFPQNNGNGGAFVVSGEIDPAAGPGCTPHIITEATGPAQRPQWRLTVSDDGARTWSTLVKPRDIGALGHYKTRLRWLKMGQFRQRVIKLECTDPVRRNVIGIYIDIDQGMAS